MEQDVLFKQLAVTTELELEEWQDAISQLSGSQLPAGPQLGTPYEANLTSVNLKPVGAI